MRWVKHMTAAWDDERIAKLVGKGGVEGLAAYGIWWRLIEIIAARVDGKSTQCSVTYDVTRWSLLLSLRGSHVRHWLEKLVLTGVLTAEWVGTEITVTIPKLLKYRDEYSKKSVQGPAQEKEKEQKETTDTEETPIPLSAPKAGAVDIWFETEFWPKWLRRPDDDLPGPALKAARSVAKTVAIRKQIMAAVEACRADRQEKEPGYRVSARRWLREGMWEVSAVESAKPQELWPGQLGGRPHPDAIMRNFKKGDFIR